MLLLVIIKLKKSSIKSIHWFHVYLFRLKGDLAYNYRGPRTKDDIVEFANRVAG